MAVFVDSSALYALLDEADANHPAAVDGLRSLRGADLVTHAYVVVEALALTGRRLGWSAVERLIDIFLPLLEVHAVDDALHRAALVAHRASGSTGVSFVDRTSFGFMRQRDVDRALAFDVDFEREGFSMVGG